MGKWREDCPDCYEDECNHCDKYTTDKRKWRKPTQQTPWQKIVEFFRQLLINEK